MTSQRLLMIGLSVGWSAWVGGLLTLGVTSAAVTQEQLPDLQLPPQDPIPLVIPDNGNEFGQPLLRGPVHEAFAELYQAEPNPGVIITQRPPSLIDESPPEVQPMGRNIEWIPGYWAFDDQGEEFLWVSGIWREIPPGFRWLPGYWLELENQQGYQWVSGTWLPETSNEVQYLPEAPPATLERGPVGVAPSLNHIWVPGNWLWQERQYAWRPGFWSAGHVDWVWIPARYQWTPRGFLFCRGYWDYPLVRRGTLFSPYRFHRPFFTQPRVLFTPRVVIAMDVLPRHMWVRPRHCHYYFGDFYDGFAGHGFVPWHHWAVGGRPGVNINLNFGNPRDFYCGFDPLFHHVSRTTVINNINVTNIRVSQVNQQFNYFNQFNQNFTSLQTFADQRPGRELSEVSRRGGIGGSGNSREARLGLSLDDHVRSSGRERFTEVRDQQRRVRLEELTQTRELATARQAIERRSRGTSPMDRSVEIASLPANPRGSNPQRPGRSEGLPTASNNRLNPRPTRDVTGPDLPSTTQSGGRRPGRSKGLPADGVPEAGAPGIVGREATGGGVGGREITGREVAGRDRSGREIGGRGVEPGRSRGAAPRPGGDRDWIDPAAAARGRAPLDTAGDRSGVRRATEEPAVANRQRQSAVEQAQQRMADRSPSGYPADRGAAVPQGTNGRRIAPGTPESELRSWVENYQRRQGVDPNTARRLGEQLVPPGSQRQIDLSAEERARQRDTRRAIPGNRDMGGRDSGGRGAGGRDAAGRDAGGRPVGEQDGGGRPVGGRETGGRGATPGLGGNPTYLPGAGQAPRNQPAAGRGLGTQSATGRNLSNQPASGRGLSNQPASGRNLSNQPASGQTLGRLSDRPAVQRPSPSPRSEGGRSGGVGGGRGSVERAGGVPSGRGAERPGAERGGVNRSGFERGAVNRGVPSGGSRGRGGN